MQFGSSASLDVAAVRSDCAFCNHDGIARYILKETPAFRILADHAPLVEGHLLIVPRNHYSCYGDVPAALDEELFALKREVKRFFARFYAPAIFWEHGVFRQTVFHAHLHCFPFGATEYNAADAIHRLVVRSQDDIRAWYASQGHYFYLEDAHGAFLFAPGMDHYLHVIQKALRPGATAHSAYKGWRTPQQRQEEGRPLIESVAARWRIFQQQEVNYADQPGTR
jgi:diadenosine tetraphosphate (Ap4A) HIT family hydrolase